MLIHFGHFVELYLPTCLEKNFDIYTLLNLYFDTIKFYTENKNKIFKC